MYCNTYKIADYIIEIQSVYEYVQKLCAAYAFDGTPDFTVTTNREDIAFEEKRNERESDYTGTPLQQFPEDYLETLAVYRKLCDRLLKENVLLFHGSALSVDGEAYLFTATSGTGKSTHARLWREVFGDRVVMVNDDKPLLKVTDHGVYVCGTPWDGKHRISNNIIVPLKAICILERGQENEIHRIPVKESLPMLLQQSFHPTDPADKLQYFSVIDAMAKQLRFYRLHCNMNQEAARVSFEALHEDKEN